MLEFDHLMWAAADLQEGMQALHELTGCEAAPGGSHPGNGTRNALLGLGARRYLEIIAPDPAQALTGTLGAQIASLPSPQLRTWAVRSQNLERTAAELLALGIACDPVRAMQRGTPDGQVLAWRLLFTRGHDLGGVLPFFIDWGDSVHPSAALGDAVALLRFEIELPNAHPLADWFATIDAVQLCTPSSADGRVRMRALLRSPRGECALSAPSISV